jgi:hypothetical protein
MPHLPLRLSNAPLRLATGAYIVNAGLGLLEDKERGQGVHKTAQTTYPFVANLDPDQFRVLVALGETLLGASLLVPFVKSRVAGLGLAAFSGALLGIYAHEERFRRSPNSVRPSPEGEALLKDLWMLAIGLALMMQRRPVHRT